jgi:hypothetical protein
MKEIESGLSYRRIQKPLHNPGVNYRGQSIRIEGSNDVINHIISPITICRNLNTSRWIESGEEVRMMIARNRQEIGKKDIHPEGSVFA